MPHQPLFVPLHEQPAKAADPRLILAVRAELLPVGEGYENLRYVRREDATEQTPSIVRVLSEAAPTYAPRNLLEVDPNYRQIISYNVVRTLDVHGKTLFLSYQRSKLSGETRLHGQRSVGFGGHVELHLDNARSATTPFDLEKTLAKNATRELHEELGHHILAEADPAVLHGYMVDDSNPVGRVHLGLIWEWFIEKPMMEMFLFGDEVADPKWVSAEDILNGTEETPASAYENWATDVARFYQVYARDLVPASLRHEDFAVADDDTITY